MAAIQAAGIDDVKEQEVEEIIKQVNFKGNGQINYSEFIAATICAQQLLTNEKLYALFKEFDHEDIEVLTIHNLKGAFLRMGKQVTLEEIEAMLSEYNVPKEGQISFDQFKQIMLTGNEPYPLSPKQSSANLTQVK